jgi:hypothetical protein
MHKIILDNVSLVFEFLLSALGLRFLLGPHLVGSHVCSSQC